MPAWDLVDLEPYRRAWTEAHGYFSLNLVSSRGCPYRCNWCAKPIFGSTLSLPLAGARGAGDAATQDATSRRITSGSPTISSRSRRNGRASSPTRWRSWTRAIPFKMQSRCDLMTRDTVDALRRAGCAEVWMGAESGSQKILDAMDKGMRVEQIYEARENLRRHGIRACFFLQFGYPGETWEDIESDHPHGARDAAGRYRRFGLLSAAGHDVFIERVAASSGARKTGAIATIWP